MPWRDWLAPIHPYSGAEIPAALRVGIAGVSGALLSLAFTGFCLSIFSWVCIGVLLMAVLGARPGVAYWCGFFHAIAFVFTSVPWIATVLSVHGGLSTAGGWGVLFLIASAWGILVGTFTWTVNRLAQRSVTLACVGAPFVWVTFEFARAHLPEISFPWNLLGYPASANLALIQLTSITGIYGLSFVVAGFNAVLAWSDAAANPGPRKRLVLLTLCVTAILAVMAVGPRFVPKVEATHYARAVQVDFPEVEEYPADWFETHGQELDEVERISLAPSVHHPDLLIWPEAPAPFSFQDVRFARRASSLAIRFGNPYIAGAIEWKREEDAAGRTLMDPYNSALLIDAQGQRIFSYDKIHLVPFGEYEPFPLIHRVVSSVSSEVGGFRKGSSYSVARLPNGNTLGVFICYEAIYAGEIRRFAANGAQLLVNISNDGWFGRSAAPEQHLRMARVRAVENRRWLVRSTNNGYTASVDPYGRIVEPIRPDVRAAADLPYDFRMDESIYTRFGDWFAWLCVAISVILLASTYWKRK
jgi:apolipoprotein N-acyltransferase